MISLLKYLLKFVITLCITLAVSFMVICTVAVIVLVANGNISIRKINDETK